MQIFPHHRSMAAVRIVVLRRHVEATDQARRVTKRAKQHGRSGCELIIRTSACFNEEMAKGIVRALRRPRCPIERELRAKAFLDCQDLRPSTRARPSPFLCQRCDARIEAAWKAGVKRPFAHGCEIRSIKKAGVDGLTFSFHDDPSRRLAPRHEDNAVLPPS